jgi:hypothetical protein
VPVNPVQRGELLNLEVGTRTSEHLEGLERTSGAFGTMEPVVGTGSPKALQRSLADDEEARPLAHPQSHAELRRNQKIDWSDHDLIQVIGRKQAGIPRTLPFSGNTAVKCARHTSLVHPADLA